MKSFSDFALVQYLFTLIPFLVLLTVLKAKAQIAKCPQNATISPCICVPFSEDKYPFRAIHCHGPAVTQKSVSTAITTLRQVNNVSDDDRIYLGRVSIQETQLEEFDLLPLTNLSFWTLDISNNPKLSSVAFSGDSASGLVHIQTLRLENNSLTDSGLQHTFDPLNKDRLIHLHLGKNLIVGKSQNKNGEFLRGLSALNQLSWLNLTGKILNYLFLNGNPLNEVGKDAFLLYKRPKYLPPREIHLVGCGLNDSKFSGKSGIERNQNVSGLQLFLWENEFETVNEDIFRPFLEAHPKNEVEFDRRPKIGPRLLPKRGKYSYTEKVEYKKNPMVCDEKLKWLKSQESFLNRVNDLTCKNDPGHTLYTTKLV